ncbi:hypothetical protein E2C01_002021 [Portunus trituberculatus]|uniref:Uncharacterized protein n=1 Tax=Portunus trituberculatus TaxID=210409 RepID=A0A5B7CJA3_PORTR|nr:hypothetical protein [Portunus trituberculatus]
MDEPRGNYSSKKVHPDKFEEIFLRKAEASGRWFAAYLRHLLSLTTHTTPCTTTITQQIYHHHYYHHHPVPPCTST